MAPARADPGLKCGGAGRLKGAPPLCPLLPPTRIARTPPSRMTCAPIFADSDRLQLPLTDSDRPPSKRADSQNLPNTARAESDVPRRDSDLRRYFSGMLRDARGSSNRNGERERCVYGCPVGMRREKRRRKRLAGRGGSMRDDRRASRQIVYTVLSARFADCIVRRNGTWTGGLHYAGISEYEVSLW